MEQQQPWLLRRWPDRRPSLEERRVSGDHKATHSRQGGEAREVPDRVGSVFLKKISVHMSKISFKGKFLKLYQSHFKTFVLIMAKFYYF